MQMKKIFVLVHGAYVGEWCFDPIIPLLEEQGHSALAVSLTGYGKKKHLYHSELSTLDHIDDVVGFVENQELREIVLVGHSLGGAVVTGAWDQLRDRVREIIFIDANTPADGESPFECILRYDPDDQIKSHFGKAVVAGIKEIHFPIDALARRHPDKAEAIRNKVMPQPLKCAITPIQSKHGPLPADVPKTFIFCTQHRSYHIKQAEEIRKDKSWRYFELATGHDPMAEDPEGLVKILVGE